MTRSHRLTSEAQLRQVQREGKLVRNKFLWIRACASPQPHPRFGLIVPRYGRTAVERNRMKRRLREIARVQLLPNSPPLDVVVGITEAAYKLPFSQLRDEVLRMAHRLTAAQL